ncbi:MAG: sugar ABC transporter ATP-binding protein [Candidatus Xenobia bacterium]
MTHLSKAFGGIRAVQDVSFELAPGTMVGLIGANGAGKSTLVQMLAGAIAPDSGEILVGGRRMGAGARSSRSAGIALVPQELNLVGDMSVAENVMLGQLPSARGICKRKAAAAGAKKAFDILGLGNSLDLRQPAHRLTSVDSRLVTLARALVQEPRVLILDEPTAALPSDTADALLSVLVRLIERGTTILYVSHRLSEIERVTSRVLAMRNGSLVADLDIEQAPRDRMVELIGGEVREAQEPSVPANLTDRPIVLSARGLCGSRVAGVDLTVRAGEIVGVAGLQGAGRSELLRLLAGVQQPTAGSIHVLGSDRCRSLRAASHRGLGYIAEGRQRMAFTGLDVMCNLTGAALERIGPGRILVSRKAERRKTAGLWERLSIRGDPEDKISSLSGGNQQKVFLGRWLLKGSRLLVLDEPTAGVDVSARADFHALLRELATQGAAVLFASSEPEEVALLCHRAIVLVEGRVAHEMSQPMDAASVVAASYIGR